METERIRSIKKKEKMDCIAAYIHNGHRIYIHIPGFVGGLGFGRGIIMI